MTDRHATLSALLDTVAARAPGAVALIGQNEAVTYGDLARRSRAVAAGLAARGIGPGNPIALWLPNGLPCFELLFACARLGATVVAVNTRFRSAEVADLLHRSGARLLALDSGFRGIDFAGILADVDPAALEALDTIVDCGDARAPAGVPGKTVLSMDALRERGLTERDLGSGSAGAVVFTTSGTTAAPKLVLHRQAGLTRHALDVAAGFGLDAPDAVILQMLPLCGTFGLTQALGAIAAGRPIVLQAAFDPDAAVDLIPRHAVTHTNATDDMFDRVLAAGGDSEPFGTLRLCGYAAFNAALEALPGRARDAGLPLVGLYGMSEVHALFARRDPADPEPLRTTAGGRPVNPAARVRIVDDIGDRAPVGVSGALEIASPTGFADYLGNPEATAAAFTADGYFRTGDVGRLTEDGGFAFEARGGDVLRLGGFLVNPKEIEAVVEALDGVAGAQVVGVDTPGGARPVAFVTLSGDIRFDEGAVAAGCARQLARFKVPARVVALDAFPVTEGANGTKIQRQKLREMAAELLKADATSATRRT